jgi:hypothetical protein
LRLKVSGSSSRIFLLRNAPAGNHELVAEDLIEDELKVA